MNARSCRCGCGVSLAGRRRDCVWATPSCATAFKDGRGSASYRKRPSGLQVSYGKAVRTLAAALRFRAGYETGEADRWAERLMRQELSVRQRARLERRAK